MSFERKFQNLSTHQEALEVLLPLTLLAPAQVFLILV